MSSSIPKANNKHNKFGELYAGLRNTTWARVYLTFQLMRRILFVVLLITLAQVSSSAITWTISSLQIIYLIMLLILRPFEGLNDNIIEIINEVFFSYFLCWLLHFNSEDIWSSTTTDIYSYYYLNTAALFVNLLSKCRVFGVFLVVRKALFMCFYKFYFRGMKKLGNNIRYIVRVGVPCTSLIKQLHCILHCSE